MPVTDMPFLNKLKWEKSLDDRLDARLELGTPYILSGDAPDQPSASSLQDFIETRLSGQTLTIFCRTEDKSRETVQSMI